jgi:hypothetical protein
VAGLDDVEDFAIGAVFQTCGVSQVGDFQIPGDAGLAVSVDAVALSAVVAVDLLALRDGFGSGLHRVWFAGGFDRDRIVTRLGGRLGFLRDEKD